MTVPVGPFAGRGRSLLPEPLLAYDPAGLALHRSSQGSGAGQGSGRVGDQVPPRPAADALPAGRPGRPGAPWHSPVVALGLTDLALRRPGPRRPFHALAYQAPVRFVRRVAEVGAEVAGALAADAARAVGTAWPVVIRSEAGAAPATTGGRRVALYAHYAGFGAISPMVRRQLALYREQGFDVIFTTNSDSVDGASWRAAAEHCCWMVQRRNLGVDFGAWQEAARLLDPALPPDELLLVNDSVLGPFTALGPLFARARAAGPGAVGLTESHQGGVHLQSYFVLVLGRAASADTLAFLARLRLSAGKWLMVQRGEFGLTRHLLRRGHRVSALFGYAAALDALLACPAERRYLAALVPRCGARAETEALRETLLRWPLNPTHHMWRGLSGCLGFPFLKTALISQNPGRLTGLDDWPALVDVAPGPVLDAVRDHLARLEQSRPTRGRRPAGMATGRAG